VGCLDEETILDMVEGRLAPEPRRAVVDHVDSCPNCRELLASVAHALAPDVADTVEQGRATGRTDLGHGSVVGRYLIIELIGLGGMGMVYSAYDPELDRRVALKLVRAGLGPEAASYRTRLVGEARAIARVAHPNVVGVHEVGTVDDQVFIAMEFVEGVTLSAWLTARPRSWREKLDVLLQAGRGLAAAHRAGLVHRDFKPDNVLVGSDGRVRVTDFGLARAAGASDPAAPPDQRRLTDGLTRTGAFVGTPAYMALEQMRAQPVDARADLFSFCVAAYESLFGVRPFAGDSVDALAIAIATGEIVEPKTGDVPPRLRRAIVRGLAALRDERPPSMDVLLAELDPTTSTRGRWAIALAVGLIGLSLVGYRVAQRSRAERVACNGGMARLTGVWDSTRKHALAAALAQVGLDGAPERAAIEATLDDYARRWTRGYTEACEATHVRGEQSPAALDLRMECLEQRRKELDAFASALADDPRQLPRATVAAHELQPVSECDNVTALRGIARPALPPSVLEPMRARLARLRAIVRVGSAKDTEGEARALADEAHAIGALDIAAQALSALGSALEGANRYSEAVERAREAAIVAAVARDDFTLARALNQLVHLDGIRLYRFADADRYASYAKETVARLGGDPALEWDRLHVLGQVQWRANHFKDAEESQRRALALFEHTAGADPLDHARLIASLAVIVGDMGRFAEASQLNRRALELYVAALGPEHTEVLQIEDNMACDAFEAGRTDEAIARERRLVTIRERRPDEEPMRLAYALNNLGWFSSAADPRAATQLFERSIALFERTLGPKALELSFPLTGLGLVELARGAPAAALPLLERALALSDKPELRDEPDRAETEFALARLLRDPKRALALARHAREIWQTHPLGPRRAGLVSATDAWIAAHQ
jgi:serine/threonine protein kinase